MGDEVALMSKLESLFAPLIGKHIWGIRLGDGTFLTLEFGEPSLEFRGPIEPRFVTNPQARRKLRRRSVHVVGQSQLWLQFCNWEITVREGHARSTDLDVADASEVFADLEGQILLKVTISGPDSVEMLFDLGGQLRFSSSIEEEDDQWSITTATEIASNSGGGLITVHPRK